MQMHRIPHLLDAGGVQADPRQRSGRHGVRIQRDRMSGLRAVPVPQQKMLGPSVERWGYLAPPEHRQDTKSR